MNTKKALELLNEKQRKTIDIYKRNLSAVKDDTEYDKSRRSELYATISGYLIALVDIGTLTQAQARLIYTYATL